MPIIFTIKHEQGCFLAKYVGKLTEDEIIESYKNFYEGDEWIPGLNELTDLSEFDAIEITSDTIRRLAEYTESVYKKHNITSTKVGVYAPKDFPFGLARIYEVISEGSPENVGVYRKMQEAKQWLRKQRLDNN